MRTERKFSLIDHESAKIIDVQEIAILLAAPSETDVRQRTAEVVGVNSKRDDALIGLGHLPRAGY